MFKLFFNVGSKLRTKNIKNVEKRKYSLLTY